ncbi:MAG: hypothetical protein ACE5I1_17490 [bacterium]
MNKIPMDAESKQWLKILLEEYSDWLNDWELEFVQSLKRYGGQLSFYQKNKLEQIYDKCMSRG